MPIEIAKLAHDLTQYLGISWWLEVRITKYNYLPFIKSTQDIDTTVTKYGKYLKFSKQLQCDKIIFNKAPHNKL